MFKNNIFSNDNEKLKFWVPVGTGGCTGGYRWISEGTSGYWWGPVDTGGYRWPLVESKYYIVTNLDCYKLRLLQT